MNAEPCEVKVLSDRKTTAFFAVAVAAIIAAAVLSGCGNDSEPAEQHHESAAAAPSDPPEAAAAASSDVQVSSPSDQSGASVDQTQESPAQLFKASCYAGVSEVLAINNLADDDWKFDGKSFKFINVDGKGDVYFNGVCIVRGQ